GAVAGRDRSLRAASVGAQIGDGGGIGRLPVRIASVQKGPHPQTMRPHGSVKRNATASMSMGGRIFKRFAARAAFTAITVLLALPSAAAASVPPIGKIDSRAVWSEPYGVDTSRCDSPHDALPRQLACVLDMMRKAHASPEALAFTRWYAATGKDV